MLKIKSVATFIIAGIASAFLLAGCSSSFDSESLGSGANNIAYGNGGQKRPKYHFADKRPATGKRTFVFDPKQLAWAAYDSEGNLMKTGIASGGANYCSDIGRPCRTPVGKFSVHREGGPNCKSNKYPLGKGGAPMPHCAFFTGGYAVHGSPDVPAYNASHGCIRVTPSAARWLDSNVLDNGSTVIVDSY